MPLPTHTAILQVTNLCFSYLEREIFANTTVSFMAGITLIRGGDGRGKSTLLRLMAGALPAQLGQLHINGTNLQTDPASYGAQLFWADAASEAFNTLSVPDYFDLQRRCHAGFDERVLADVVSGLGLQEHLHKQLFMLSTGSRRKVFLAAAFAAGAAVTLIDEPFTALDAASIAFVLTWLKAADDASRAWVIADYVAPGDLHLAQIIELGD